MICWAQHPDHCNIPHRWQEMVYQDDIEQSKPFIASPFDLELGIPEGGGHPPLLPQSIAAKLRILIATDALPAGQKLRERHLSEQLQVSRTPLREALKILAGDGLVTLLPNRGAVVVDFSPAKIREKLDVLGLIEGHAGQLACKAASDTQIAELRALHHEMLAAYERRDRGGYFQRNQGIHAGIVAAAGNASLVEVHELLNRQLFRYRYQGSVNPDTWDAAIDEHQTIMQLLTARDGEGLGTFLQRHVHSTWDKISKASDDPAVETGTA
ncbi:MAG: GntR family transcriptional regulator [Acetobacteraceae bacterium]